MGREKITDEQLKQCLKDGMKQREIAEKYKMHPVSVANRIKKMWAGKKVKSTPIKEVWEDLIHGMEAREAAEKYEVTVPTIYNYIKTKGGIEELYRQRAVHEEIHHAEQPFKTYGQQKAEELKDQTKINPNDLLQEMLEREKTRNLELMQKVKELEKDNARLIKLQKSE